VHNVASFLPNIVNMYDALSALQLYPTPVPRPTPAPATLIRRVDVVDERLNVLLTGTSPADLREANADDALPPNIAAELAFVVAKHDFERRPIATALAGTEFALRVARLQSAAGAFYHVYTERTMLRRLLGRVSSTYRLGEHESELLRLLVGGYDLAEITARIGVAPVAIVDRVRLLERKLNCVGRQALVTLVYASPFPLTHAS